MGLITARIQLSNPTRPDTEPVETKCLVDTGALHLCVPEHIAIQLGYDLSSALTKEITTAEGKRHTFPYVGPIKISFKNRTGIGAKTNFTV